MLLSELGFDPFFSEQELNQPDTTAARVLAEHRGLYRVYWSGGEAQAQLAGRFADLSEDRPAVGDWVQLRQAPVDGQAIIIGLYERRSAFSRGAAGRSAKEQVIAANIDVVFIVSALDGDYNQRRIERYLARVWASGAQPVVVLSKADLCPQVEAKVAQLERAALAAPVLALSTLEGEGLQQLNAYLEPGKTMAFVGSSGVGKSTLINALLGEDHMATRAISQKDGRGRHTTTHRELIALPNRALLIDTPGMRELKLADEEGLDQVFADIEALAASCRFSDCSHQNEPGCAVVEAVACGELDASRLKHYLELEAEAQSFELRRDEGRRRAADKVFGKMVRREAKRIRRYKEGR